MIHYWPGAIETMCRYFQSSE